MLGIGKEWWILYILIVAAIWISNRTFMIAMDHFSLEIRGILEKLNSTVNS